MWRMVWREKASFGSSLTALICPYSPEPFLHRLRLFHPWTQRGREKALCRNRFVAASDTLFFVVVRFSRGQVGWVQIHAAKWIMQSKAKRNFSFFFFVPLGVHANCYKQLHWSGRSPFVVHGAISSTLFLCWAVFRLFKSTDLPKGF